jgi:quercetin 2,3-dioxygenase
LRTGRGAWHAEALGAEDLAEGRTDTEARTVLFWVNLARRDKQVDPSAQVLLREQIPTRHEGDAIVRVLVGEGSPIRLGTPAVVLDVELPTGGQVTLPVPPEFQGFAYVLDGEAEFGANRRRAKPPQLVLLGPGETLTAAAATPGMRFMLMAGKPYGEVPVFNGPYVD